MGVEDKIIKAYNSVKDGTNARFEGNGTCNCGCSGMPPCEDAIWLPEVVFVEERVEQDATDISAVNDAKVKVALEIEQARIDKYWRSIYHEQLESKEEVFMNTGDLITDAGDAAYGFLPTNTQGQLFTQNKTLGVVGNVFNGMQVVNGAMKGGEKGGLLGVVNGSVVPMAIWALEARGYLLLS
jgi:hypothetical protein